MDLRQLEYFVAVAEEASFTAAAMRVHISQSGVSAQIRQLERELGQRLLDRSSRSVRLTEAGATLLPHARATLAAAADGRLAVDQLAGLVRGRVTVGMVSGCALPVLAQLLADFHRLYPGVTISLVEAGSDQLVDSLRAGELDLALVGAAGPATTGVQAAVIDEEPLVAAVALDHPLARHTTITLAALADQPLISLPPGTGVRSALDAACAEAGLRPRVALQASALPMVAHLAELGLGVGIVPASIAQAQVHTLHAVEIRRPRLRSRLELTWNTATPSNPAARTLVEHARAFLDRGPTHGFAA